MCEGGGAGFVCFASNTALLLRGVYDKVHLMGYSARVRRVCVFIEITSCVYRFDFT